MNQQRDFAVPKERQDVTVHLDGGMALEGGIFLEYSLLELSLHHKIVAFLEDDNEFFPIKLKNTDQTEFIQKKNIKLVELTQSPEQEVGTDALSLMHIENIAAFFTDESSISGSLMAEVPAEKARLSDCLNLPDKFLHVKVDKRICYINKGKLRKVLYGAT